MINPEFDRSKAPLIKIPSTINIVEAQKKLIKTGMPFYYIKKGLPNLIRLELIFDAGTTAHANQVVPNLTNSMLDEGSLKFSSSTLADKLDFMGADLGLNTGKHTASISFHILDKYFDDIAEPLMDMILNPVFPEHEFSIVKQSKLQSFLIKSEKTEFLAAQKFNRVIFGKDHPYGKKVTKSDFLSATPRDLFDFHAKNYKKTQPLLIVSGQLTDKHFDSIESNFDFDMEENKGFSFPKDSIRSADEKQHFVHKEGAVQASIRMGKPMINKTHPDYIKLKIANVVLGGYFGSRLMTNIREEKGYTYGIYSSIGSLFASGYFLISAETKAESAQEAIKEIKKELKKLRTELIAEDELKTVKHYLLGSILENFDGPEANADAFKSVYFYGMSYDYYREFIETLKNISPGDIRDMAQKYLQEQSMYEVICSDKKYIR